MVAGRHASKTVSVMSSLSASTRPTVSAHSSIIICMLVRWRRVCTLQCISFVSLICIAHLQVGHVNSVGFFARKRVDCSTSHSNGSTSMAEARVSIIAWNQCSRQKWWHLCLLTHDMPSSFMIVCLFEEQIAVWQTQQTSCSSLTLLQCSDVGCNGGCGPDCASAILPTLISFGAISWDVLLVP